MTTKHTPGPWKVGQYLGSLRQFVIHTDVGDKGRGSDVAVTSIAFGSDETVANARLIAAAPDLLRYLKEARRTLEMWKDVAPAVSLCADIDAAIARATGEQL